MSATNHVHISRLVLRQTTDEAHIFGFDQMIYEEVENRRHHKSKE